MYSVIGCRWTGRGMGFINKMFNVSKQGWELDGVNVWTTFEGRLQHGSRFGGQEDASGVLVERSALLVGDYQLSYEASPVSDVVVLVVFAEVEDVLGQQLGLGGEAGFCKCLWRNRFWKLCIMFQIKKIDFIEKDIKRHKATFSSSPIPVMW